MSDTFEYISHVVGNFLIFPDWVIVFSFQHECRSLHNWLLLNVQRGVFQIFSGREQIQQYIKHRTEV